MKLKKQLLNNHILAISIGLVYLWFGGLKYFPELSERIKKFRRELMKMSSDISEEDMVIQLNIQAFPSAIVPQDAEGKKS